MNAERQVRIEAVLMANHVMNEITTKTSSEKGSYPFQVFLIVKS